MRITKKRKTIDCDYIELLEHNVIVEKLGRLEDIEERLGIDLITLFKALQNGFYTKSINGIKFWKEDDKHIVFVRDLKYDIEICCEECENAIGAVPTMFIERSTKDYGKTWALTKEEIDNEKETKKKSNYDKVLDLLEYAGADGDFLFEFENEIREIVNKLNAYDLIRAAKKEGDR